MAMTQSTLLFVGVFATGVGYLGLFKRFEDNWTSVLLTFASALTWAYFGLVSQDVIVPDPRASGEAYMSEPIAGLFYFGMAVAFIMALFAFFQLVTAIGEDASDATGGMLQ